MKAFVTPTHARALAAELVAIADDIEQSAKSAGGTSK